MSVTYKNLVFDVGGVLMDYRWEYAVADAGITLEEARRVCVSLFHDTLWNELDLGIRPYKTVVDDFCKKYPEDAHTIRFFLEHPENMPIDRPKVWEEVHRLKEKGYHLYILSNYSEYMYRVHTGGKPFHDDMDGELVSYTVHLIKPDPAIYKTLLKRFGLEASECLYFDDRDENTEGAENCGIRSVTVRSEEHLLEELRKL